MKLARPLKHALAWMAVGGLCLPGSLLAADARPANVDAAPITDVALGTGGMLTGQFSDVNLAPCAGAEVFVWADGRVVATTHTNANGSFAVAGLRGGLHQVTTAEGGRLYRFWAPGTAPPGAADSAQLIRGQDVVLGQWEGPSTMAHEIAMWATNPFLVGGVIAAAVAVPIILNNTDDDDSPNS
jgi:hypothetical protein